MPSYTTCKCGNRMMAEAKQCRACYYKALERGEHKPAARAVAPPVQPAKPLEGDCLHHWILESPPSTKGRCKKCGLMKEDNLTYWPYEPAAMQMQNVITGEGSMNRENSRKHDLDNDVLLAERAAAGNTWGGSDVIPRLSRL